jgi:hypothetical protein
LLQATNHEVETQLLKDRGVVIDTYFLDTGSQPKENESFQWMAKVTGGNYKFLNICEEAGARELIDNITARYCKPGSMGYNIN